MAKKNKDQGPAVSLNNVANRDIIQRLNFLYQASAYLNSVASHPHPEPIATTSHAPSSKGQTNRAEKRSRRHKERHPATAAELSRSYVKSMKIIGQKTTVKMDPTIKRTLCKGCNTILIPGATASVRIKPSLSHGHSVSYICMACKTTRKIPAPPIVDPDAPPEPSASTSGTQDASQKTQSTDGQLSLVEETETIKTDPTDTTMPDHQRSEGKGRMQRQRGRRKKPPVPRIPPLFQRKGHVIFRGNERLEDDIAELF
ncbi:hypothetical protein AcV5_006766 [Taiwanofungus camphoratus]|nr:hypothetical protein AcV5_006766 [Antrodia cinnamomea]KAI0935284.1 hypothetical protein AcV7_003766 [Antrodia cinnamomea]